MKAVCSGLQQELPFQLQVTFMADVENTQRNRIVCFFACQVQTIQGYNELAMQNTKLTPDDELDIRGFLVINAE